MLLVLFVCLFLFVFFFALNWLVYILIVHELITNYWLGYCFLIEPVCDFDSNCFLDYGNQLLLSSNDTTTMCDICSSLPNATELSSGNIMLLRHCRYIPFSYSHNKQCHIIIGLSRFSRHLRNEIQLILFSTT